MELKIRNCYYCEEDFYTDKDDDKLCEDCKRLVESEIIRLKQAENNDY